MIRKDLSGKTFGRLKVLQAADRRSGNNESVWICICDCGNLTEVSRGNLISGHTKSCGCLGRESREKCIKLSTTHNMSNSRLYHVWNNMIQRCTNSNNKSYKNYGGRGITVSNEWHDFKNFAEWAKDSGYQDYLTLELIDNNGNYCIRNCRWATRAEQASNKRNNRKIIIEGTTYTISKASREFNIPISTIRNRLNRGIPDDKAILKKMV